MSGASKKRTRQERIESLGIPKPRFVQWWNQGDKADLAIRVSMSLVATVALLFLCQTWKPTFSFRNGTIPDRDVISRVNFQQEDTRATDAERLQKRKEVPAVYLNRPKPLQQLRAALKSQLVLATGAASFEELQKKSEDLNAFNEFRQNPEPQKEGEAEKPSLTPEEQFDLLKMVIANDPELEKVDAAVAFLFDKQFASGLLKALQHPPELSSNQQTIAVYQLAQPDDLQFVQFDDVQIGLVGGRLKLGESLRVQFDGDVKNEDVQVVAKMVSDWIVKKLPDYETLEYDDLASEKARVEAAAAVQPVMKKFYAGTTKLVNAGEMLGEENLSLLRLEHQALVDTMRVPDKITRVVAYGGMLAAIYLLCGSFIFFVDDRRIVMERGRLVKLLGLLVLTISDGSSLVVHDTSLGPLGALACGEMTTTVVR